MRRAGPARRWVGGLLASCVGVGVIVAVPAQAPAAAAPSCVNDQLQHAPVVTGDVRDDGSPVAVTKDRRGKQVPIVLVPGAGEDGRVSSDSRTGPFAHPVDLAAGTATVADTARSLLGELQNLPGTDVFVFDYAKWDDAWVDDAHLGPALGSSLACLRQATGERAIVVTQSTGSLVARWALTHPTQAIPDPTSLASTVVTFGAPDAGSTLGLLAPGGVAAAERAGLPQAAPVAGTLRLLAAQCAAAPDDPADGSWCDQLDRTTSLATGDIGRALTVGSSQLAALAAWPSGIAVHDLHASIALTLPAHGWFGSKGASEPVAVGDLSDLTAALPKAAKPAATCAVTVAPTADGSSWKLAATDSDDPGSPVATATSPCLATDLTRTTELVANARAVVLADLFRRQPLVAKDLLAAPVPPLCQIWPSGVLRNGVFSGPSPDQYAEPPTLATTGDYRTGAMLALGDLDGDGIGDAASVVNCTAGGVGWPDYVVMWGSGLRLLGAYFMGDAVGEARSGTRSIAYDKGSIVVDGLDARPWDAACCVSGRAEVTLKWDGKAVVASDVQHLQGPHDYTFSGIGDIKIGMSRQDLEATGARSDGYGGYSCTYYATSDGVDATVDNASNEVIRVGLPYNSGEVPHTYPEGVGVGSTLSEVYAAYKGHVITNHLDGGFGQGSNGILVKGDGGYLGFGTDDLVNVSSVTISDANSYGILEVCSG